MISTTFKDRFDQFAQNISINGRRDSISYDSFLALLSEIDKQVAEEVKYLETNLDARTQQMDHATKLINKMAEERKELVNSLKELSNDLEIGGMENYPSEVLFKLESLISKYSEEK